MNGATLPRCRRAFMEVGSIFRHEGGLILNPSGKYRDEPDPPGWYFWMEAYGYQELFGPFESIDDAEMYCEANGD
jgi:hypothetical protein